MRCFDFPCSQRMLPVLEPAITKMPEDPRLRALCRPSDYAELSPQQRKAVDRELNLLDWDESV